jgi:hypothetical protein
MPQCFKSVRKTPIREGVICWCDCYIRGFDDLKKVERLSMDAWATYIKESTGIKICQAANNDTIINIALAGALPRCSAGRRGNRKKDLRIQVKRQGLRTSERTF